jgi:transposase, IS30 family
MKKKKYSHLTREERHVFYAYLRENLSLRGIEKRMRRKASGLCREIKEHSKDGTREGYEPDYAHLKSQFLKWDANRRKPLKSREVMEYTLEKLLKNQWSPDQIAKTIKLDYPDIPAMRISHETIYQFINSEEGKELGLAKHLRHGRIRKTKKKRDKPIDPKKQAIPDRISIHERPSIVNRRIRFGDWESDLMEGAKTSKMVLSVQKELKSQYVFLKKLRDKSAEETKRDITRKLKQFPKSLRRTITFDNGRENTKHMMVTKILGIKTYFCDPYSSWQKGSVENVIGLIRQYIPKGTDLNVITEDQIKEIEYKLNNRPRKCLGYRTPHQVLSKHLKNLGVQLRG